MRALIAVAASVALVALIPAPALALQTSPPATIPVASLDSACTARVVPAAGSALLAGVRELWTRVPFTQERPPLTPAAATMRALKLTAGWYAVILLLGLGVLIFGGDQLRRVSETLAAAPGRALTTGLLADLAALPVLVGAVIVLALTILGILLIPFAVVALMLLYAGVALLGFLAVARATGAAIVGRSGKPITERGSAVAGIVTGVTLFLALWLAAAIVTWSPVGALILRAVALAVTAVAVTVGVGAVVRTHWPTAARDAVAEPEDTSSWQTPTPVGGVIAARRSPA